MRRLFSVLAGAALALSASPAHAATNTFAAPAPAPAGANTFTMAANKTSAYGTYDRMLSIPERPVPPVIVNGTLAVNAMLRCAVVQIAYNGPTDAIKWRTVRSLCRPGKSNFRVQSEHLRGGARPPLRLCSGLSVEFAERSRRCDVFKPPVER